MTKLSIFHPSLPIYQRAFCQVITSKSFLAARTQLQGFQSGIFTNYNERLITHEVPPIYFLSGEVKYRLAFVPMKLLYSSAYERRTIAPSPGEHHYGDPQEHIYLCSVIASYLSLPLPRGPYTIRLPRPLFLFPLRITTL